MNSDAELNLQILEEWLFAEIANTANNEAPGDLASINNLLASMSATQTQNDRETTSPNFQELQPNELWEPAGTSLAQANKRSRLEASQLPILQEEDILQWLQCQETIPESSDTGDTTKQVQPSQQDGKAASSATTEKDQGLQVTTNNQNFAPEAPPTQGASKIKKTPKRKRTCKTPELPLTTITVKNVVDLTFHSQIPMSMRQTLVPMIARHLGTHSTNRAKTSSMDPKRWAPFTKHSTLNVDLPPVNEAYWNDLRVHLTQTKVAHLAKVQYQGETVERISLPPPCLEQGIIQRIHFIPVVVTNPFTDKTIMHSHFKARASNSLLPPVATMLLQKQKRPKFIFPAKAGFKAPLHPFSQVLKSRDIEAMAARARKFNAPHYCIRPAAKQRYPIFVAQRPLPHRIRLQKPPALTTKHVPLGIYCPAFSTSTKIDTGAFHKKEKVILKFQLMDNACNFPPRIALEIFHKRFLIVGQTPTPMAVVAQKLAPEALQPAAPDIIMTDRSQALQHTIPHIAAKPHPQQCPLFSALTLHAPGQNLPAFRHHFAKPPSPIKKATSEMNLHHCLPKFATNQMALRHHLLPNCYEQLPPGLRVKEHLIPPLSKALALEAMRFADFPRFGFTTFVAPTEEIFVAQQATALYCADFVLDLEITVAQATKIAKHISCHRLCRFATTKPILIDLQTAVTPVQLTRVRTSPEGNNPAPESLQLHF